MKRYRPSQRARALVEALHEASSNEARWMIVDECLREERDDATEYHVGTGRAAIPAEVSPTEGE